jgi:hypothetical protein
VQKKTALSEAIEQQVVVQFEFLALARASGHAKEARGETEAQGQT